jgi:hypothetical protein
MKHNKNKENQGIDFRLLITQKEKPRFFLLCQPSEGAARRLDTADRPHPVADRIDETQ